MTELKFAYPDIPFNVQSIVSSAVYDGDFPVKNIVNGPLAAHARLQTAIAGQHTIEFDLGSGVSQSADYFALLNAKALKHGGVEQVTLRGSDASYFNWNALSWTAIWDFSRDYTIDSANRISQINDLSGNGNHATQSTDANKPLLSRADNKENVFLYSEDWGNTTITYGNEGIASAISAYADDSEGNATATRLLADTANSRHGRYQSSVGLSCPTGTSVKFWVEIKYVNNRYIWVGDRAFSSWHGVLVDFNNLTIAGTANVNAYSITPLADDWYLIFVHYYASSTATPSVGVYLNSTASAGSPNTYVGAGTEEVLVSRAIVQSGESARDYYGNEALNAFRATITNNTTDIDAPNGTETANKIVEDGSAAATHGYTQLSSRYNVITGVVYTVGIYVARLAGTRTVYLNTNAPLGSAIVKWNPATGALISSSGTTVSASAGVDVGGGWYYCSFTVTGQSDSLAATYILGMADSAGTTSYNGDGSSAVYTWGHTVTANPAGADSDYVPTTTFRQYRGINGNRVAVFDGTNDYLLANGVATTLAGSDKPFTVFFVMKLNRLQDWQVPWNLSDNSHTAIHRLDFGAAVMNQYRRDDASVLVSQSGGVPTTNTRRVAITFTGTTFSLHLDGTAVYSGVAADVGTSTYTRMAIGILGDLTTYPAHMRLCFMAILPGAIDATNREAVEDYLTNRFQTAPPANIDDVDTLTLTGPNREHYITHFDETDAHRYWAIQFDATESSTREAGKLMFGKLFDIGHDPERRANISHTFTDRSIRCTRNFTLPYTGITSAKREEFREKIEEYRDENLVVMVSEDGNPILQGQSLIPCAVKDVEFKLRNAQVNEGTIELEELI